MAEKDYRDALYAPPAAPCDLAAIRARLAAITPGPRRVRLEAWETQAYVDLPNGDVITFDTDCAPDDAAFDAAAPADIAALLAEVERLRAELEAARAHGTITRYLAGDSQQLVLELHDAGGVIRARLWADGHLTSP